MRAGFQQAIAQAARMDPRIQMLSGDHGYQLFDSFSHEFPERFHNVGVSEANMVGIAAGMARNGLRPIIYGLASFVPNRVFELIKLQIALDKLPVVMVGDGAGLVYSYLGKSHQTLEDLALMGTLPQVTSLSPGSDTEMLKAALWALQQDFPVYLRMGKSGGEFDGAAESETPEPVKVHASVENTYTAIVAHGAMVSEVLSSLKMIRDKELDVWSCPTIFPVAEDFLRIVRREYSKVFVAEEHGIRGGLASELLIQLAGSQINVEPMCAQPPQSHSVGSYTWILDQHKLSAGELAEFLNDSNY